MCFTRRAPPNQRLVNKQGADFEQSGDCRTGRPLLTALSIR
jgi:hypothetical protein